MTFSELKRVVAVTGHYGCGKTNFSLNLAIHFASIGEEVTLIDLDLVNPYFLSSDFTEMLRANGITVIASKYAGTMSETPTIPREIQGAIRGESRVIIDVGGDDVGARALGRFYNDFLEADGVDLIYLFSIYRPQTGTVENLKEHMNSIEYVSRQKIKYLINSSNLGKETSREDIEDSKEFAESLVKEIRIPLLATLATVEDNIDEGYFKIQRYVKLPWEKEN